ncbi:DUF4239-containing protein [Aureococcus anophagefferens]|nr:DUF4239-containing protein [Aureococcus anophagefferens]
MLALLATASALTAPPRRVRRVGARLHAERRLEQLSNALKAPQPRRSYAPPGEFYECGTLDSKSFDAPEGDRSLSRTVSVVAAYLAYPAVVAVLSQIPPPNAVEGGYQGSKRVIQRRFNVSGYFFSLISIVFGTLTASTISDATSRLGALRGAAVEECTLMLPLVKTLEIVLLEDDAPGAPPRARRVEVFEQCAEQLWLHSTDLIAGTRELELEAMASSVDNLGTLYATLRRAQLEWRGDGAYDVLTSALETTERLMEARGVRLSLENSGIPPVQFSVLRALSVALVVAYTYLTLDRPMPVRVPHMLGAVTVDGALVFDASFGVHVLFAGLYRLESNTVAASLKQLRATIRPYVTTTPLGRVRPSDETAASLYGERVQLPNDL